MTRDSDLNRESLLQETSRVLKKFSTLRIPAKAGIH